MTGSEENKQTRTVSKASTKLFLRALAGETNKRPPFWLMRQAGRYLPEYREVREQAGSFLDLCYNPELATEVTLQPIRRFGMDAAILFADILVVPDALGQRVAYAEGEGPVLDPVCGSDGLHRLTVDRLLEHLAPILETVRNLRRILPDDVALIGFAGAPWTVATYMVEGRGSTDHAAAKGWAYRDPTGFAGLIDLLVDATARYLSAQATAGAEALQIFDTWAGVLPEPAFRRWVIEPTAEIVRRIRLDHPAIPIIGFPRGAGVSCKTYAAETEVQGLGLDTTIPISWAASELQPTVTVQGNLDPQLLMIGGDAMENAISEILRTLAKGPFIFNLGHGVHKDTPPEHVAALASIVQNWRG